MEHVRLGPDFRSYSRFLTTFVGRLCAVAALASPILGLYVYQLRMAGEFIYSDYLARLSQSPTQVLWLSGYYDAGHYLKGEIGTRISPEVAVFGSSRVMQLRPCALITRYL